MVLQKLSSKVEEDVLQSKKPAGKKGQFSRNIFSCVFWLLFEEDEWKEGNSQMPKTVLMRKVRFLQREPSKIQDDHRAFGHALLKHFQNDKRAQIELKRNS